jgi:2-amino-4-hydroxy-6-hydroxymethyldihydropteridine diphosphokinase
MAYLSLGSNLGDREWFLRQAVSRLKGVPGLEVVAASAVYLSQPQDMTDDSPTFLNQVIKIEFAHGPEDLLAAVEKIESDLGRTGKGERSARTIDIDILTFGGQRISTADLKIPHPRLTHRPFALIPLLEIDSDYIHPATGKPLSDYVTKAARAKLEVYKDHVARQA